MVSDNGMVLQKQAQEETFILIAKIKNCMQNMETYLETHENCL